MIDPSQMTSDELWAEAAREYDANRKRTAAATRQPPPAVAVTDLSHQGRLHRKGSDYSWDEPDWSLLDDRRGDLPEFPLAVLPVWLREWAAVAAHGAGVTPGHVALPLIAIASSLIGVARRIQASRSWSEPMTCWGAVVGYSGSGKTPGIDVTKRHLAHIEKLRKEKIAELKSDHEARMETAKAAQKKWKKDVEEAVAAGMPAPPRPPEATDIGEFVSPRLYISDATIERIAILLQASPRGTLVICDELAGLFLNMGRYSNGSDREFWLEAWNGKAYVVERMGRPAVMLDNLLVGIVGGLQPDKLVKSFEGDHDGMYARVLFAWPPEPGYAPLTDDIAEIEPIIINALSRLIDLDDGEDGEFVSRAIGLSSEAREDFEQFRQFLHGGKEALDGRGREWWAKGASHVLRLAGALAYLDWANTNAAEPTQIDRSYVAAAIGLWRDYLWPHSQAALRQIGLTERHTNARQVLRWSKSRGKAEISIRDVRRDALGQRLDAKQTRDVVDGLVLAGWLRPIEPGNELGRPSRRWQINPALRPHAESAESAKSPRNGTPHRLSALPALSAPHLGLQRSENRATAEPIEDGFGDLEQPGISDRRAQSNGTAPALGPPGDSLDDFK